MAKNIKSYDVFISSPSDVSAERDIVEEAIDQINQIRGKADNFQLTALRWESDVSSQIGAHPQEIINQQIGDDYDIFIGILCTRFGQETNDYNSGTEEEFYRAYDRHRNEGAGPEILFYFKDARKSDAKIDARQFLKVEEFRDKISTLGVYEDFETSEILKTKVVAALIKAVERLEASPIEEITVKSEISEEKEANVSQENALIAISDFDEDIGIIDISEMIFDGVEAFNKVMAVMNAATERLNLQMNNQTEEIGKLKKTGDTRKDQNAAKPIIDKSAAEMQRFSHIYEQSIPDARREFSRALRCMEHAVIISNQDGMDDQEGVEALVSELEALVGILSTVQSQISGFRDAISAIPRMTTKLNQAKRRAVDALNNLLSFVQESSGNIETSIGAIKR